MEAHYSKDDPRRLRQDRGVPQQAWTPEPMLLAEALGYLLCLDAEVYTDLPDLKARINSTLSCVNAMAGIPDPAEHIAEQQERIKALEKVLAKMQRNWDVEH